MQTKVVKGNLQNKSSQLLSLFFSHQDKEEFRDVQYWSMKHRLGIRKKEIKKDALRSEVKRTKNKNATQLAKDGTLKLDSWGLVTFYRKTLEIEATAHNELLALYESFGMFMKLRNTMKSLFNIFVFLSKDQIKP